MIKTVVKNGIYQLVQTVKYSNGKIVERTINKLTGVPESVVVIQAASK
jgi:hypothetical protein